MQKYNTYKNSGVYWLGQIPEQWELTKLGTRFLERRTKVSDKYYEPLSVTKNGVFPQLDSAAKSNDGDNRKLVKKGDFVINSRSDRKASSGISDRDGSVSLIYIVIEPVNINSIYCNYLLRGYNFVEEFYRMGHGIVADLWTTRYDEMKSIMVAIPPIKEQTAIANFLDNKTTKIDQAIAIKQKQIELLKERRQILIHKAVTRGLNDNVKLKDSSLQWIGEIPEHWEVEKFKFYIKLRHGNQFRENDFTEEGIKIIKISQLHPDGYIDISKASTISPNRLKSFEHILIKENDVLMCLTGGTIGKIIRAKNVNEPLLQNYRVGHFSSLNKNLLNEDYMFLLLSSKLIMNQILVDMSETGQPNIGMEDMKNMYLVIPNTIEEQQQIVEFIETATAKIAAAISLKEQEIDKLKEYKMSLIDGVVTGKVKVF